MWAPGGVLGWESSEGLPTTMSLQRVCGETPAKRRKVLLDIVGPAERPACAYMFNNTLYNGHRFFLFRLPTPSRPLTHGCLGLSLGALKGGDSPVLWASLAGVWGSLVPRLRQMTVHTAHCADHRADPDWPRVCARVCG